MSRDYELFRQVCAQLRYSPFSGRFWVTVTEQSFESGTFVELTTQALPRGIDPDQAHELACKVLVDLFTESDDRQGVLSTQSAGRLEESPM